MRVGYDLKEYFKSIGMPSRLSEIGIDSSKFPTMASEAVRTSNISKNAYVKLVEEDVIAILNKCG